MRIITAVGEQLPKTGFRDLGVNSLAQNIARNITRNITRTAEVDKVLIYRYFGGLPELLKAYSQERDSWPTSQEQIGDDLDSVLANSAAEWLIYF
jgi:hypothetical protein